MAAKFELNILGDIPPGCDLKPLQQVVIILNALAPDWLHSGVINLKLVDDAEIRALNRDYSGNDYATDVLSFSYIESGERPIENELGDMLVAYQMAARQAKEAGTTLGEELATLGLHGILHINELDHQTKEEKKMMDNLQRDILTHAGIAYRDFKWTS